MDHVQAKNDFVLLCTIRAVRGNFYLHCLNYSVHPPPNFKKKILNYPPFFSPHPRHPSLNISSPVQSPSSSPAPPSTLPSPPPFTEPSPHSPAPALSRCPFSTFRHQPFSAPSASSLSAPFGQTGPNGEPLFGPVWPNGGPLFGHGPPFGQTWPNKGPLFDQIGPNRVPLFGPVWPNDAEREGGAGGRRGPVPESRRGVGRVQVPRSRGRVLKKGEEMEGRGVVPGRRKGAVPERRRRGDGLGGALLGRGGVIPGSCEPGS